MMTMTWILLAISLGLLATILILAALQDEEPEETQMFDGDSIILDEKHDGFVHQCCSCGLRHVVYVRRTDAGGTRVTFVRLPEGELKGFKFEGGQVERLNQN
tara:strand:- start:1099 stop:1404 length:306 start_codon:yes stop_codon:yes gene_type:complete